MILGMRGKGPERYYVLFLSTAHQKQESSQAGDATID